mmetsp:Transcript_16298/g.29291  ORF Transcript_16298/g.29291 Transcript_16298/m.29291 type:complete len:184 (+) Transcript_16298:166-717(+)
MGHSTGCQDAVTYCKRFHSKLYKNHDDTNIKLDGVILQAPVSDRESMQMEEGYESNLKLAKSMIDEGKKESLMPRDRHYSPISAYRYHSLAGKMTDDDMFSSDIPQVDMVDMFECVDIPALLAFSGSDEYVPGYVDKKELAHRMESAMKYGKSVVLDGADHACTSDKSVGELIDEVHRFLVRI